MHAYYCDHFVLPLPEGHRFPMEKYALLRERVAGDPALTLSVPDAATDEALVRVHDADYIRRVEHGLLSRDEVRRIGFPWSAELVERSRRSVGGTVAAAHAALEFGISANLAGGTHHAFSDRGEGFCVFNDVAVAARDVQASLRARRCAVVDLDVHQGNGTAAIFGDDDSVFTVSVHGEANYPFRKEESDLDVPLPDGADDEQFLEAVRLGVRHAISSRPELVFYVAGADAYVGDKLGRLSVSKDGMRERDSVVFDACAEAGIPLAIVMSGGYAETVGDIVDIHAATVLGAAARACRQHTPEPTC